MSLNADRWIKVRTIFFAALEVEPSSRASLVRALSDGDDRIEQEVNRLLDLDARAGSFLDRPACDALSFISVLSSSTGIVTPQLAPGDIIDERFQIISLIGAGGMGEVYEARDQVLGDSIAVKIVRPGLESLETMATRLLHEAALARRVAHSSVCRVHDVIRHRLDDGRTFLVLTMELVRGDTLRSRLHSRNLSTGEVLEIASQVAAGLDAAHANGVLHRDVKPDNIILERRPHGSVRAVLTDFGLARAAGSSSMPRMTQTGMVAGTLAYMAPELLRGEGPSRLSDLYAFAMVVREMLLATRMEPSAPQREILRRALAHDPQARFPTAYELVDALIGAEPQPMASSIPGEKRRVLFVVSASVLLAIVFPLVALRLPEHKPAPVARASQVLLTDIVNETNDRELDGATEVLRSQLQQSPHFELMPRESINAGLMLMQRSTDTRLTPEVAREVAMDAFTPLVVYASLTQAGNEYVLKMTLEEISREQRPVPKYQAWTQTFSAVGKPALFTLLHDASLWVRDMSGETPAELYDQNRQPIETASSSWEALGLFAQAEALVAARRPYEAVHALDQAVRIDPDFITGFARLGELLVRLASYDRGYQLELRAITMAERRRLTNRDVLRRRGQYFQDMADLAAAEETYRTYAVHYPSDYVASYQLGLVLLDRNRMQDAVQWFDRASEARPYELNVWIILTEVYLDMSRLDRATAYIDKMNTSLSREWAQWLRALATFTDTDVQGALAVLEPLRHSTDKQWQSRASLIRACWLSEMGDDTGAATELRAGIAFDSSQERFRNQEADKWLTLADLQFRAGQREAAATSAQHALDLHETPRRLAFAGELAAKAGDLTLARRRLAALDGYLDVPLVAAFKERIRGEILLVEGDADGSVQAFKRVVTLRPRREHGLSLARALTQEGDLAAAESTLREMVSHPARLYMGPEAISAGSWRRAILDLIALTERRDPAGATTLRTKFRHLLQPSLSTQ